MQNLELWGSLYFISTAAFDTCNISKDYDVLLYRLKFFTPNVSSELYSTLLALSVMWKEVMNKH